MRRSLSLLTTAAVLLPCGVAQAESAPPPISGIATAKERGWIAIQVRTAPGAVVRVKERTTKGDAPVAQIRADQRGSARRARLAVWRCERRHRSFVVARVDDPAHEAAVIIRTPRCDGRLTAKVGPRRAQAGRPVTVSIADRWKVGRVTVEVCTRAPRGTRKCRDVRIAEGASRATYRFRPKQSGRWRFSVAAPGAKAERASLPVRRRGGGLRILATGDSMMQIVDSFLKQRLNSKRVKVSSQTFISTGISKPSLLNWPAKARSQARSVHPDVTLVFLGANDGFPIGGAQCCGRAWVVGYAKRVRGMMRSYQRRGSGTVYWLLLPTPGRAQFQPVFRGVNAAVRRAARGMDGGARVIDLVRVFTPGGRFRTQMRWHGATKTVRQDDRVHLSTAGASIAASVLIRELRRDGVLT